MEVFLIAFLNEHETFTKKDHIIDYKTYLSTFQRMGDIQSMFPVYSGNYSEIVNNQL